MLSTCTENEVTLAIGASVPTTKAAPVGPVGVVGVVVELLAVMPPLQPTVSNAAVVRKKLAIEKDLPKTLGYISHTSHSG
jgi:hypothetical protein